MDKSSLLEEVRRSFNGDQLRVARELRSLTQAKLARLTAELGKGTGVTGAAISQFEVGSSIPSLETIASIVKVLEVDAEFLTHDAADDEADTPAFFRSLRSTPARDRKRARNIVQLVHRLTIVLEEVVDLPNRDIPLIPGNPFGEEEMRRREAEKAAGEVRRYWKLPRGPIKHVIRTIETRGIVCTHYRLGAERVDAFSVPFSDHPVVVFASDKDKWDRSRFDAAHELGHIVMHEESTGLPEAEKQANEFAAAFLMPARDIRPHLPTRADWRHLIELKSVWGTSVAALLYRAKTLQVMSEKTYVGATKVMSARGWRRHEPLNKGVESPRMLRSAIARAVQAGITSEQLRVKAVIPKDLFSEVYEAVGS